MKVSLRAKIKDEKQRNDFYEVLKLICDQEKLQLEERGECVVVEICPQGMIECREDEGSIRWKHIPVMPVLAFMPTVSI